MNHSIGFEFVFSIDIPELQWSEKLSFRVQSGPTQSEEKKLLLAIIGSPGNHWQSWQPLAVLAIIESSPGKHYEEK